MAWMSMSSLPVEQQHGCGMVHSWDQANATGVGDGDDVEASHEVFSW